MDYRKRRKSKKLADLVCAYQESLTNEKPPKPSAPSDAWARALSVAGVEAPTQIKQDHILWPCNVRAWELWLRVQGQWLVADRGRYAINVPAVDVLLRVYAPEIKGKALRELWDCILACSYAVLEFDEKNKSKV